MAARGLVPGQEGRQTEGFDLGRTTAALGRLTTRGRQCRRAPASGDRPSPRGTAATRSRPLASTLDVFHTKHEAQQALAIDWNQVERDCEAFDKAEDQLQRTRRGGIPAGLRPARPVAPGPRWSRASIITRRSRRLGSTPKRRWRCSGPTANSTIEPGPRPRSPTPCRRWSVGPG